MLKSYIYLKIRLGKIHLQDLDHQYFKSFESYWYWLLFSTFYERGECVLFKPTKKGCSLALMIPSDFYARVYYFYVSNEVEIVCPC